jgi:hypothetical protein
MALTIDQFMDALSGQESGGDYTAQNARTGAYGRFQIMQSNWPSWAEEAGIGRNAPQTPANQEKVARFKLQQYYDKFGNWEDVASAWYSGSPRSAYTSAQLNRKQGNGDEPSISEYVSSVMQRAGGGSQMADPEQATYESIIKQIDAMMRSAPSPGTDEYLDWLSELSMLTSAAKQMRPSSQDTDPNATATQGFQNKVNALQSSLAYDQTNLSRAIADIDRFLGGQEESRARADTILSGQDMIRRWGTPEGKTGYSLADLGAGFEAAGAVSGIDSSKPFINYTGTTRIDPEADMRRYDQAMGVTGGIPGIPGMITQPGQIPGAPDLDMGAGLVSGNTTAPATYSGTGASYTGPTYDDNAPGMYDQNPDYQMPATYAGLKSKGTSEQTRAPGVAEGGMSWGDFLTGDDGKYFGIGGPNDLKPAMPKTYAEWLLGKDKKLFGIGF